jgi:hypothetical protein
LKSFHFCFILNLAKVFYFIDFLNGMARKKFPKSIRKFIRKEKTRIRREISDLKEQKKAIEKLYQQIISKISS